MKKLNSILVIGILFVSIFTVSAQAASFTLFPTDDVTLQGGRLYNNWDLWTRNYHGEISYPLLKFTASSDLQNTLVSESITAVSLELFSYSSAYGTPDVKMYYYNNDNWNETQASMPIPAYDTTNPIGEISPLPPVYDFFSTDLDIAPFLADDNGIYSLVLNNIDPSSKSNTTFTSKDYPYGPKPASYYAPRLHIETAAVVPEPATMLLFGVGLLGFAVRRRKA